MLLTLFFYTKDFGADDSDASIEELENSRIEFSDDNDYQSTPPEEEEENSTAQGFDEAAEPDETLVTVVSGTDADGDTLSYSYTWTVGGTPISATGSTLTSCTPHPRPSCTPPPGSSPSRTHDLCG